MNRDPDALQLHAGTLSLRTGLWLDGDRAKLTSRERELLVYLVDHARRTVTFDELHLQVWEHAPSVVSRAAYHSLRRLREKIERDPDAPEHLVGVHGEGVRFEPLPSPPPPGFFGRRAELAEVESALASDMLVTVVGPGGVGKTTLCNETVRRASGACLAELAPCRDLSAVLIAIGRAFGMDLRQEPSLDALAAARPAGLIVLDNAEQALRSVAAVAAALGGPLLVSSRAPLGLDGEHILRLGPLDEADGSALFLHRAGTQHALDEVHALVVALQGLPLAIELAAARARLMRPADIRARLDHRLALLADRRREGRHATLAATLAWSWDLLNPLARDDLARLSLFPGEFDLPAAEALLDPDPPDAGFGPDRVEALVEQSLVQARPDGRLVLLEDVRAFAASHLASASRRSAAARFAAHFARHGTEEAVHRRRHVGDDDLTPLLQNLDAGIDLGIEAGRPDLAAACWRGAYATWSTAGPLVAIVTRADHLLAYADLPDSDRCWLLAWSGQALRLLGRGAEGLPRLQRALVLADPCAHPFLQAHAAEIASTFLPERDALPLLTRALEGFEQCRDAVGQVSALSLLGNRALASHDLDAAVRWFRRALALVDAHGLARAEATVTLNLGLALFRRGEPDEAAVLLDRAIHTTSARGDARREGLAWLNRADLDLAQGRHADALGRYARAMDLAAQLGERITNAVARLGAARCHLALGQRDDARAELAIAIPVLDQLERRDFHADALRILAEVELAQRDLEAALDAVERATAIAPDDPHVRGLIACTWARLHHQRGDTLDAASWLRRARAHDTGEAALAREVAAVADLLARPI